MFWQTGGADLAILIFGFSSFLWRAVRGRRSAARPSGTGGAAAWEAAGISDEHRNAAQSSFTIVPTPFAPPIVALIAFERLTRNVSVASFVLSPLMVIEMVFCVSPGLNVSVPLL